MTEYVDENVWKKNSFFDDLDFFKVKIRFEKKMYKLSKNKCITFKNIDQSYLHYLNWFSPQLNIWKLLGFTEFYNKKKMYEFCYVYITI